MSPSESRPRPPSILRHESNGSLSPGSLLGLNSASPRATPKSVSISAQYEVISPLMLGNKKSIDEFSLDQAHTRSVRQASFGSRRLPGRLSRNSSPLIRPANGTSANADLDDKDGLASAPPLSDDPHVRDLIDQVSAWIKAERNKQTERRLSNRNDASQDYAAIDRGDESTKKRRDSDASDRSLDLDKLEDIIKTNLDRERRLSSSRCTTTLRRKSSLKSVRKPSGASSDTDYYDGEILVPSSDVVLDNSKTLSYPGGASDESDLSGEDDLARRASCVDEDAWAKFKFEIVRLAHTLRLKGWRRVPMDMSDDITVERLSGALTNAVYVVSPPLSLPIPSRTGDERSNNGVPLPSTKRPVQKLLLRIYGAQADHLIDREAELAILRRLAKKRIGPRMLGTFANGRFEEFFSARPLTPEDLRNPETSRQIAKRMRELHDGIELLPEERAKGPFVWRNWDKWLKRVEDIVCWLDGEILALPPGSKPSGQEAWKRRGFICGAPWYQFRSMVEKYRRWLEEVHYGSVASGNSTNRIREQLIFSHNDTQYGNILRLMPTGESPLLLPANTHKQLVVIDFEYASPNTPGLEFANHFTEWCYNYHDARKPYAFHPNRYPTREEQERFVRSYVRHRPQFNVSTPKLGPTAAPDSVSASSNQAILASTDFPGPVPGPGRRPTSSIGDFMVDARAAPSGAPSTTSSPAAAAAFAGSNSHEIDDLTRSTEKARKAAEDAEVARLLHETRVWRLANTAQWVAWGIVQAKVPGLPAFDPSEEHPSAQRYDGTGGGGAASEDCDGPLCKGPNGDRSEQQQQQQQPQQPQQDDEPVEDEFDYLGYAQHRAMFFWADAVQLGLVRREELPEDLRGKLKMVAH